MVERTLIYVLTLAALAEGTAWCEAAPPAHVLAMVASQTSTTIEDLSSGDEWADFDDQRSASKGRADQVFSRFALHGFVEAAGGGRILQDSRSADDFLLGESRGRLQVDMETSVAKAQLTLDFVGDVVTDALDVDLRNAWVDVSLGRTLTIRAGQQILTWGTGDFLFLNDLFPKDFQSFFVGRADEFLKAPSTSVRATLTLGGLGIDAVWTPFFAPDRFVTGERLSFFFLPTGERIGPRSEQTPIEGGRLRRTVNNGEQALRIFGSVGGWELAAYGYLGFFKQPVRFNQDTMTLDHPRLGVYGASVRGALFGSIVNLEGAFYHSYDDTSGSDPFVPNSQVRALAGFSSEILPRFTLGLQGYAEYLLAHKTLLDNSPFPALEPEELRLVITLRLNYLALSDNLKIGFFGFYSPTERDAYLRPTITYRIADSVEATLGGNVFYGDQQQTFFGQLENNSNVYARLRYSY